MPIVTLPPGRSVELSECKGDDKLASTSIANHEDSEGKYVIAFDLMPLSVQHTIAPGASVSMCGPAGSIQNNGDVTLTVTTPGL